MFRSAASAKRSAKREVSTPSLALSPQTTMRVRDINDNRPQFERVDCKGIVPRNTPIGTVIPTLSALDFDAGDIISYRVVSGNGDECFDLDEGKGSLSIACDLRTLHSRKRVLNVTATDLQHFSDVTPIVISFKNRDASRRSGVFSGHDEDFFECSSTGVARRLSLLALSAIAWPKARKLFREARTLLQT